MAGTQQYTLSGLVSEVRERLSQQLREQAEQLKKTEQSLQELRSRHEQLEQALEEQLGLLEKAEPSGSSAAAGSDASLEKLLAGVRNLITATLPEQVFEALTEEAEQLGVRGAVFDVRGKAAWGSSARGFGPQLNEKALRSIVVPLSQDNPFRQVYETAGHVDASGDALKKVKSVFDKFKPGASDPILLLPIRSAGSVAAIFYADPGGKSKSLPVDALKVLAEFAGAQLDRLMALSGGMGEATLEKAAEAEAIAESEPAEAPVEAVEAEPSPPAPAAQAAPAGIDISHLSEADQKVHKDAKRFVKLLISEIELYNKAKVAEGRKNKDIFKRLKSDIERSRQTYEKRFGKTVALQHDYIHEELIRTLANNDLSLMGSDYPGPQV